MEVTLLSDYQVPNFKKKEKIVRPLDDDEE